MLGKQPLGPRLQQQSVRFSGFRVAQSLLILGSWSTWDWGHHTLHEDLWHRRVLGAHSKWVEVNLPRPRVWKRKRTKVRCYRAGPRAHDRCAMKMDWMNQCRGEINFMNVFFKNTFGNSLFQITSECKRIIKKLMTTLILVSVISCPRLAEFSPSKIQKGKRHHWPLEIQLNLALPCGRVQSMVAAQWQFTE